MKTAVVSPTSAVDPDASEQARVASTSGGDEGHQTLRTGRVRRLQAGAALVSYSLLSGWYFWPTLTRISTHVVGSAGDPSLFMWYLRWVPWAISHGYNPLFSGWLNAPHGVNLMWNSSVILPGILMAPVTARWGPVVTYNLLAASALPLTAWTGYLAVRRLCRVRASAAWLGGLIIGFSPFMVAQSTGHLHLTFDVLVPVLVVAAHEVAVAQTHSARRGGMVLGLVAGAQCLIGEELLAVVGIGLGVGLLVLVACHRDRARARVAHGLRSLPWVAGGFAVVAGWPLLFQFFGPQAVHGPVQPQDHYVADLQSFVVPADPQFFRTSDSLEMVRHWGSRGAEWCNYLGVPLILALIIMVVWHRRRPGVVAGGLSIVMISILSLGPHLHVGGHNTGVWMPWAVPNVVPPFESLLPVRLAFNVYLILAALVAVTVDSAFRVRHRMGGTAVLVGVGLALLPLFPKFPFRSPPVAEPHFFRSDAVKLIPDGAMTIVAPYPEPRNVSTLRWQEDSHFRFRMQGGYEVVPGDNGKPDFIGPSTAVRDVLYGLQDGMLASQFDPQKIIAMREEMRTMGATALLVGPMQHHDEVVALFTKFTGRAPTVREGVALWTGVGERLRHG